MFGQILNYLAQSWANTANLDRCSSRRHHERNAILEFGIKGAWAALFAGAVEEQVDQCGEECEFEHGFRLLSVTDRFVSGVIPAWVHRVALWWKLVEPTFGGLTH